jgi:glycopeptide antibiotics resistance protein
MNVDADFVTMWNVIFLAYSALVYDMCCFISFFPRSKIERYNCHYLHREGPVGMDIRSDTKVKTNYWENIILQVCYIIIFS